MEGYKNIAIERDGLPKPIVKQKRVPHPHVKLMQRGEPKCNNLMSTDIEIIKNNKVEF